MREIAARKSRNIECTEIEVIYLHLFAGTFAHKSREKYGLHLIQEEEEGCTAGLLSTFPDFEIKFAGEDKLYFSPFSVLYIAEENNKNLSSL